MKKQLELFEGKKRTEIECFIREINFSNPLYYSPVSPGIKGFKPTRSAPDIQICIEYVSPENLEVLRIYMRKIIEGNYSKNDIKCKLIVEVE